jgi:hypothetical protein
MTGDEVAHAQRRREHGEVLPVPADRAAHREARLDRRHLHRDGGEQAGRDEVEVRQAELLLAHDRPQPDPHRREVEHRVEDARHHRPAPHAPVDDQPVLVRAERVGHD